MWTARDRMSTVPEVTVFQWYLYSASALLSSSARWSGNSQGFHPARKIQPWLPSLLQLQRTRAPDGLQTHRILYWKYKTGYFYKTALWKYRRPRSRYPRSVHFLQTQKNARQVHRSARQRKVITALSYKHLPVLYHRQNLSSRSSCMQDLSIRLQWFSPHRGKMWVLRSLSALPDAVYRLKWPVCPPYLLPLNVRSPQVRSQMTVPFSARPCDDKSEP